MFKIPRFPSFPVGERPSVGRKNSDQSASSTPTAVTSSTGRSLSSAWSGYTLDATNNLKRFSSRFRLGRDSLAESNRLQSKGVLEISIGEPQMMPNPVYDPGIKGPSDEELIPKVEILWHACRAGSTAAESNIWTTWGKLGKLPKGEIANLKAELDRIDAKVNAGIDEFRITAYAQIRQGTRNIAAQEQEKAGSAARTTLVERVLPHGISSNRRKQRLSRLEQMAQEEREILVGQAIGRFMDRVIKEFLPKRRCDIQKACRDLLGKHFEESAARAMADDLVNARCPQADMVLNSAPQIDFSKGEQSLLDSILAGLSDESRTFFENPAANEVETGSPPTRAFLRR